MNILQSIFTDYYKHNGDERKKQAYRTYEKNETGCICFRRKGKNDFYSEREQI